MDDDDEDDDPVCDVNDGKLVASLSLQLGLSAGK